MEFVAPAKLTLAAGCRVRVANLVSRGDLNGCEADVLAPAASGALSDLEARWIVRCELTSEEVKVRARNLVVTGGWPGPDDELPTVPMLDKSLDREERAHVLCIAAQPFGLATITGLDLASQRERIGDAHIYLISVACQRLVSLRLDGCVAITDTTVAHLTALPAIRALSLRGCDALTDAGVTSLASGHDLLPEEPEEVRTGGRSRGLFAALAVAMGGARRPLHLESLQLDGCHQLTDAAVLALAEGCRGLQTLGLGGVAALSDRAVCALARNATLTALTLDGCSLLTDTAIAALARTCRLVELSLGTWPSRLSSLVRGPQDVPLATDWPAHKAIAPPSVVRGLAPAAAPAVSDFGVRALAEDASQTLTALDLSGNGRVSDVALGALSARCSQLAVLRLAGCPRLTDAALAATAQLTALRTLDVEGCAGVSQAAVQAAKAIRAELQLVHGA